MLAIICLVIGIIGFVKGKISVTGSKELRGGPMYLVATLFCLPLPLSFLAGIILGVTAGPNGVDASTVNTVSLMTSIVPLIVAGILAFALAKPKLAPPPSGTVGRGFEVNVPGQPPPRQ